MGLRKITQMGLKQLELVGSMLGMVSVVLYCGMKGVQWAPLPGMLTLVYFALVPLVSIPVQLEMLQLGATPTQGVGEMLVFGVVARNCCMKANWPAHVADLNVLVQQGLE